MTDEILYRIPGIVSLLNLVIFLCVGAEWTRIYLSHNSSDIIKGSETRRNRRPWWKYLAFILMGGIPASNFYFKFGSDFIWIRIFILCALFVIGSILLSSPHFKKASVQR